MFALQKKDRAEHGLDELMRLARERGWALGHGLAQILEIGKGLLLA